jgi:hypothetical protein
LPPVDIEELGDVEEPHPTNTTVTNTTVTAATTTMPTRSRLVSGRTLELAIR